MSNCVVQSTQSDAELAATKLARESVEKRIVLMLNDYPLGVYTTEQLADAAARTDWERREPRWKEQGLTMGHSMHQGAGVSIPFRKYYYNNCEFTVDAEARL